MFAFQYGNLEKIDNYVYGNLSVWIGGKMVGDYETYTTISISISFLIDFLHNYQRRVVLGSELKSAEEVFFDLYELFYCDKSLVGNKYLLLGEYRDVFWLDEVGEYSFRDNVGIILINEPVLQRQRFIWKDFKSRSIEEFFVEQDIFDNVSKEFIKEFFSFDKFSTSV